MTSFLLFAVLVGLALPLQAGINSQLRTHIGHPLWAAFVSGGLLGATFVTSAGVLAPRLGAATLVAAVVAGQMVGALLLDHYGVVGYPQHSLSIERVTGVMLVMTGVALIQYR